MTEASERDQDADSDEALNADVDSFERTSTRLERLIETMSGWSDSCPSHQRMFPDQ